MRYCWRTTFLAIRLAIWPQKKARPDNSSLRTVPENPATRLAAIAHQLDHTGHLIIRLPGCHPLAAPAILFRLKREGYSDCRVTTENGGLLIEARR